MMESIQLFSELVEILNMIKNDKKLQDQRTKIELKVLFLKLTTDDSFSYNNHLNLLKEKVFQLYRDSDHP